MEWKGVNLSDNREKRWLNTIIFKITLILFAILISSFISFYLTIKNQQLKAHYFQIRQEISDLSHQQKELNLMIDKIEQYSIQENNHLSLSSLQIKQAMSYLKHLVLDGILDSVQINSISTNSIQLKLVGRVVSHQDFEKIEKQLIENKFQYQFDKLQTNENDYIEFSLIITIKEEQ